MAYSIDRYNSSGAPAIIVEDGTINTTLDLKLIGKNYAGYGEAQNENFLWLLENFSSRTAPPNSVIGQLWYDSSVGKLKVNYSAGAWRTLAVNNIVEDGVSPSGLTIGDFWWNTVAEQLFCRSANNRDILIGGNLADASTQLKITSVTDINGNSHSIITAIVNGVVTFIISETTFTLSNDDAALPEYSGFLDIGKGITLNGIDSGGITSLFKVNGTALDAENLAGVPASAYVNVNFPVFPNTANFSNDGFTVGPTDSHILEIFNDIEVPVIKNKAGESIVFKTTDLLSSTTYVAMELFKTDILPGTPFVQGDGGSSLGASTSKFANVYADSFEGKLQGYDVSEILPTAGTIPVRTSAEAGWDTTTIDNGIEVPITITMPAGSIFAEKFAGQAYLSANADLAENYLADAEYEVGTVLMIGGTAEVTAAQENSRAIGVVSNNPAYIMNVGLEKGTPVALKGRVPVKVSGTVTKGDRLISTTNGLARTLVSTDDTSLVFAIAISNSNNTEVSTIEALIL